VDIPPRFDVGKYAAYGIIQMTSTGEDDLGKLAMQRFMQSMQEAKSGTVILELGTEKDVLASVGKAKLDPEAVRLIAEKNKVNALITGVLDVSKEKLDLNFKPDLSAINAKSQVKASLSTKIYESTVGATVWTTSRSGTWNMSALSTDSKGLSSVNIVTDKEGRYEKIVSELAAAVTSDFRPTYEWRDVKK